MTTPHHVLVLLDPSSELGERSLDYALSRIQPPATAVTLFVTLSGKMADAFRDFAPAEDVTLSDAAQAYLDQLAARPEREGLEVNVYSSLGHDLAAEIRKYANDTHVGAAVLDGARTVFDDTSAAMLLNETAFGSELGYAVHSLEHPRQRSGRRSGLPGRNHCQEPRRHLRRDYPVYESSAE